MGPSGGLLTNSLSREEKEKPIPPIVGEYI